MIHGHLTRGRINDARHKSIIREPDLDVRALPGNSPRSKTLPRVAKKAGGMRIQLLADEPEGRLNSLSRGIQSLGDLVQPHMADTLPTVPKQSFGKRNGRGSRVHGQGSMAGILIDH